MHASLRRQLLHLATDLAELMENPGDLPHGFDLLTRSCITPAAEAARAGLRTVRASNQVASASPRPPTSHLAAAQAHGGVRTWSEGQV